MNRYSGYITDIDGTLLDTKSANIASYAGAFSEVGRIFKEDEYRTHFGLRFDTMMDFMAPESSEDERNRIKILKRKYYKKNHTLIKVNFSLVRLLSSLSMHTPIGMATTADEANAKPLLETLKLINIFSHTLYGNDVIHGKPNPECYNLLLDKMNLNAEKCLIFEDSPHGIAAAQASGADVFVVSL